MALEISRRARAVVRARLADATLGWQAAHGAIAVAYGVPPVTLDTGPSSKNLVEGFLTPSQMEDTTAFRYPLFVLYSAGARQTNEESGRLFSGVVSLRLELHFSWRKGNAPRDTETELDAAEAALAKVFEARTWPEAYAEPLAYGGDLDVARGPLQLAGENWRQTLSARLTFGVSTN